jgi:Protein of unknown function (DUF3106)
MNRRVELSVAVWLIAATSAWPQKKPVKEAMHPAPPPKAAPGSAAKLPRNGAEMKSGPRINAPNENVERLLAMPPEQRERVLEKLPAARQNALRKRFEQFDKRPPEERARLLEMWKHLETLSPEKRETLTRQMQAFNALPEERRKVLGPALNQLRRLSPEDRESRLNDEAFRARFSPEELKMMSDIAENYPIPAK